MAAGNYDSPTRFKDGDKCEDLDGNIGHIVGRNIDASDNYTHWIVCWKEPVHDQFGHAHHLMTSIRSVELI